MKLKVDTCSKTEDDISKISSSSVLFKKTSSLLDIRSDKESDGTLHID